MQNLNSLVTEIKASNKMSSEDLLKILSDSVESKESPSHVYKSLYKKAYGNHLSKETCEAWVKGMDVTDDSERPTGEKWTIDKTYELGSKMGVDWSKMNKYEWYAAMNAWYSDCYRTAKKYEIESSPEYFADLVLDYFCYDTDAHDKSVFCYYFNHVA